MLPGSAASSRAGLPHTTTKGGAAIAVENARVNDEIRVREVRLVDPDGEQMGVKPLPEALEFAQNLDLDLVEVAPNASPPVCRVMDYGKYKYEQDQRRKEARKKQAHVSVKEMKFRPKIDEHDYTTKVKHVERFLRQGSKVKLTIMFRGREVSHPELGRRILDRVAAEVEEIAVVENYPRIDGRNMTMVLAPAREGRKRRKPPEAPPVPETAPAEPSEAPADEAPSADTGDTADTGDNGDAEETEPTEPAAEEEQPEEALAEEPAS